MFRKVKLFVCTKSHCKKRGAKDVLCGLKEQVECQGMEDKISVKKSGCLGMCGRGPTVEVLPLDRIYGFLKLSNCEDFIKALRNKGKPPKKLRIS